MTLLADEVRANGLAWAVTFPPNGGPPRDCPREPGEPGWDWLHYDLVHAATRGSLRQDPDISPFALHTLLHQDDTTRIETDGKVVAGVLPAFVRSAGADEHELTFWHFALSPQRLVTVRRRPNRTLFQVWQSLVDGAAAADGPAVLIDLAIADFARETRRQIGRLSDSLDALEEALLERKDNASVVELSPALGVARREATCIRRALAPLSRLLDEDADELPAWACTASRDVAHRQVHGTLDDITALQDRARSLQDELTTCLAEETNRRLYIVSVVTTLLLPATFVTGYFGMNTGGLPLGGDAAPNGTFYASLICLATVAATLGLLRWRRLL
jgi:zinc transporter